MACGWSLIVLLCDADSAWANQNESASKSPFQSHSDGCGDIWLTDWSARGFQQSRDKTINSASVVSVHTWTFNNVNNVTVLTANGFLMDLFLMFVCDWSAHFKGNWDQSVEECFWRCCGRNTPRCVIPPHRQPISCSSVGSVWSPAECIQADPLSILCTPIIFTARQRFHLEEEGTSVLFHFRNFCAVWKINGVVHVNLVPADNKLDLFTR